MYGYALDQAASGLVSEQEERFELKALDCSSRPRASRVALELEHMAQGS